MSTVHRKVYENWKKEKVKCGVRFYQRTIRRDETRITNSCRTLRRLGIQDTSQEGLERLGEEHTSFYGLARGRPAW